MQYRNPVTKEETELAERFTCASRYVYKLDWHPKISVFLWESTFVDCFSIDVAILVGQTGMWVDWSLKHGKPMLCSYRDWFANLSHPDKDEVKKRFGP